MLELKNIKKDYTVAGGAVHALKGVSLKFRKNEFVSILGASGCGKTTLLNIIGGLDKYTSGDLLIEGISTKRFTDRDWDTYRNHSIGFIFQSYHLIPHQTILQNVELALMIAGVDKEERRRRAVEALEKVGLADKIHNRPNQLSGGQAQRVAIARALINDPEIVLADEPTGALDSKTSVQIMELLKEISKDRLVIMVTHNPELAERYSTRIIRLLDGEVTDDSMPYDGAEEETYAADGAESADESESVAEKKVKNKGRKRNSSMSTGMAFSLSLKNLLSKGKRTTMVSVAGSIGIIGVSMVLAISAGVKNYIANMENDMLSGYPISVTETAIDYNALLSFAGSSNVKVDLGKWKDKVYVDSLLDTLMSLGNSVTTNVITEDYKSYVDSMPYEYYNAIQYGYDFSMSNYIYTDFTPVGEEGADTTRNVSVTGIRSIYTSVLKQQEKYENYADMISTVSSLAEIPNNYEYILSQYDILATYNGKTEELSETELTDIFESEDSLIMVIDNNSFTDLNFGQYGYMTEDEFLQFAYKSEGSDYDQSVIDKYNGIDASFFVGEEAKTFMWYPNDTVFRKLSDAEKAYYLSQFKIDADFVYNAYSDDFDQSDGIELKVKVILQKKSGISYGCLESGLYYTEALTNRTIASAVGVDGGEKSQIVEHITQNGELASLPYMYSYSYYGNGGEVVTSSGGGFIMPSSTGFDLSRFTGGSADYEDMLKVDLKTVAGVTIPAAFYIYPVDFKTKDKVCSYLDKWNNACESGTALTWTDANGAQHTLDSLTEADKVTYNDTVGLIISMVNTMIEMVTVALVAFTALSLVVSTVMVGIITYVSVVERIKEIGILRAVGARKKDIKRLFNAETFIIGLAAGLVGIAVTYILSLVLNLVIGSLFGISGIAALPIWQALIMVVLSVALTLISGLLPASAAAKKDPVVALRTE